MKNLLLVALCVLTSSAFGQIKTMATFETLPLPGPDTFWNGSDSAGFFRIQDMKFENTYNHDWKFWSGFVYSNMKDTLTPGVSNQYSAFPGAGANYSETYALVGTDGVMTFDRPRRVHGCYVTNSTFSILSMRHGDQYAKAFGGKDGNDKDYFRIIAEGYNTWGQTMDTFYLADFRFDDNDQDYMVEDWRYFDLSTLGDIVALKFRFESSDTGAFGMNTPAYFCMDNFDAKLPPRNGPKRPAPRQNFERLVQLDSALDGRNHEGGFYLRGAYFVNDYNAAWNSWSGWALSAQRDTVNDTYTNDKSAIVGQGYDGSSGYVTGYNRASIYLDHLPDRYKSFSPNEFTCRVTNSTYAYKTMLNGNQFAKKFGGDDGNDQDYLVLKISGVDFNGKPLDTVEHYLADFRYTNNTYDYISKSWRMVDLAPLMVNKSTVRLDFWVEGSDTGQFGLNTPGYFCLDNLFDPGRNSSTTEVNSTFEVYPNPTTDVVFVSAEVPVQRLQVLDMTGKIVMESDDNARVDLSALNSGMYMLSIDTGHQTHYKKVLKQ